MAQQQDHKSRTSMSPDSKCPICLDSFDNISYLDLCGHKFCFCCIHEWSKIKEECPLCKQPFKSIYQSKSSEQDFIKRNDLPQRVFKASPKFYRQEAQRPERIRAENGRATNIAREPGIVKFRRELYRQGVRVRVVHSRGRPRDTSAKFYQRNPACLQRLIPWLKRELTVLNGPDGSLVNIVQHFIVSCIKRYDMEDGAILEELRPFLLGRTEHFLHELINFAKSRLSVEEYDKHAVYNYPAPSSNEDGTSNSSVIVISEDEELTVHSDPPGEFDAPPMRTHPRNETNMTQGEVSKEEDSSTSSDYCVIVGFVKPLVHRTPELVQLSSESEESDPEDTKEVPHLPQHIHFTSQAECSSTSSGSKTSRKSDSDRDSQLDSCSERRGHYQSNDSDRHYRQERNGSETH